MYLLQKAVTQTTLESLGVQSVGQMWLTLFGEIQQVAHHPPSTYLPLVIYTMTTTALPLEPPIIIGLKHNPHKLLVGLAVMTRVTQHFLSHPRQQLIQQLR